MEENKVSQGDFAFGIASLIGRTIDAVQKVTKCAMTTIDVKKDVFPKVILLKWIEMGVELSFVFTDGVGFKLYEPENLSELSVEYQERLANINNVMAQLGFKKIESKVKGKKK